MKPFMSDDASQLVGDVLGSGWIGEGPRVAAFEEAIASRISVPHICAVNSGTSALELAVDLAGLSAGDTVISTPMTCAATNIPLVRRGIRIKWADIDPTTGNIDPRSIASCLDERDKAIMIMDWGGTPCDLDAIRSLAQSAAIPVIEDAAQSFGARYKGQPVGSGADFVCFSFQAIKTITTGDGGALVCRSNEHHQQAKRLRWFGIDRAQRNAHTPWDFDLELPGYKFHMNDIAAAIGLANLPHLETLLAHARTNTLAYDTFLAGLDTVRPTIVPVDVESSHWLYTLLCERRDELMAYLLREGVGCAIAHARNDRYRVFSHCFAGNTLSGVDTFSSQYLNLPVGYWVSLQDVERICDLIRRFYAR
jgi:dTDP-4-amino-4,6-dideoxygalactose transaminase